MGPDLIVATVRAFVEGTPQADRIAAVEDALRQAGQQWRRQIGTWVTGMIPVETLVPSAYPAWRPLVADSLQFVFSRLSDRRLAAKLVEQVELPADTTTSEFRFLRLISQMPGLQKLGQVVARNRRLSPELRDSLSQLENGMCDVAPQDILAILQEELGDRIALYDVRMASTIFKEGTASAIVRFTWRRPGQEPARGVFKVLKPYVPQYFREDMTLLQELGRFLAERDRHYEFAVHDVQEMLVQVRLLLEHELDFPREQATLAEAATAYRASIGIRVPALIVPLCTSGITAMTDEEGVKITDTSLRSPVRRRRIAEQAVEALVAVPLFSRSSAAVFHADPHAGNLLYDQPNRELILIDWALSDRLTLETRRQVVMLVIMMSLGDRDGVARAILALSRVEGDPRHAHQGLIERMVTGYFEALPPGRLPGTMDAMRLLDDIALQGVRFPPALLLFRKSLFTLDGVLRDIAGEDVHIDSVLTRDYLTRWLSSLGLFHYPLTLLDLASIEWNSLVYPLRRWTKRLLETSTVAVCDSPRSMHEN